MRTPAVQVLQHLPPPIGALLAANTEAEDFPVALFVDPHREIDDFTRHTLALQLEVHAI
ncbi:hypothetical protein D3C74_459460 [compost metagenome]